MLHANSRNVGDYYRALELQARIECADPHQLVSMLYDELLLCVDVLTVRAQSGDRLGGDPHAHRARAIILSLRSGLDRENGGPLADSLDGFYLALAEEFEEHLAAPDPLRFAELKAGIGSIASAWQAIV